MYHIKWNFTLATSFEEMERFWLQGWRPFFIGYDELDQLSIFMKKQVGEGI